MKQLNQNNGKKEENNMKQYWITTIVCMVITLICIVYIFKNIDKDILENTDETTEDEDNHFLKIGLRKDRIGFNIEINTAKTSDSILLIIIVLLLELIPIFNIPLTLYSIFQAMLVVLDKKENR